MGFFVVSGDSFVVSTPLYSIHLYLYKKKNYLSNKVSTYQYLVTVMQVAIFKIMETYIGGAKTTKVFNRVFFIFFS